MRVNGNSAVLSSWTFCGEGIVSSITVVSARLGEQRFVQAREDSTESRWVINFYGCSSRPELATWSALTRGAWVTSWTGASLMRRLVGLTPASHSVSQPPEQPSPVPHPPPLSSVLLLLLVISGSRSNLPPLIRDAEGPPKPRECVVGGLITRRFSLCTLYEICTNFQVIGAIGQITWED